MKRLQIARRLGDYGEGKGYEDGVIEADSTGANQVLPGGATHSPPKSL